MSISSSERTKKGWAKFTPDERSARMKKVGGRKPIEWPHGDLKRYLQGCRCLACRVCANEYESTRKSERRRRYKEGRLEKLPVGCSPDPDYIRLANTLGLSVQQIRQMGKFQANRITRMAPWARVLMISIAKAGKVKYANRRNLKKVA